MNFSEALEAMKNGHYVKRPHWGGYWCCEPTININGYYDDYTIMMYDKNGDSTDLTDTKNSGYTLDNLAATDFIIATPSNTPILGGEALFDFNTALNQVCKGAKITRASWDRKEYIFVDPYTNNSTKIVKASKIDNTIKIEPYSLSMEDFRASDWTYYE